MPRLPNLSFEYDVSQNMIRALLEDDLEAFRTLLQSGLLTVECWNLVLETINPVKIAIERSNQEWLDLCTLWCVEAPESLWRCETQDHNFLVQAFLAEMELSGLMQVPCLGENADAVYYLLVTMKEKYRDEPEQLMAFISSYFPLDSLADRPQMLHYICYLFPHYGIQSLQLAPGGMLAYQNHYQSEVINIRCLKNSPELFQQVIKLYLEHQIPIKYPISVLRQIVRDKNLILLVDLLEHHLLPPLDIMHNYSYGGFYEVRLLYFFQDLHHPLQKKFFQLLKDHQMIQKEKITGAYLERINDFNVLINLFNCLEMTDLTTYFSLNQGYQMMNQMAKQGMKLNSAQLKQLQRFLPFSELLPTKLIAGPIQASTDPHLRQMLEEEAFYLANCCTTDKNLHLDLKYAREELFSRWSPIRVLNLCHRQLLTKKVMISYYRTYFPDHGMTGFQRLVRLSSDPTTLPYFRRGVRQAEDFLLPTQNGTPWLFCNRVPVDRFLKMLNHAQMPTLYLTQKIQDRSLLCHLVSNDQAQKLKEVITHPKFDLDQVNYHDLVSGLNYSLTASNQILSLIKEHGLFERMIQHEDIWIKMLQQLLNHGTKVNKIFFEDWIKKIDTYLQDYGSPELCHICCSYRQTIETSCQHRLCHYCVNKVYHRRCPFCRHNFLPLKLIPKEEADHPTESDD